MTEKETKELEERVRIAEEILGELSSGWWQAALGRSDTGAMKDMSMGERVLAYWRRFEAVPFVQTPCPDCKAKQARIDRLRKALFSITEESVVAAIEVLRETKP